MGCISLFSFFDPLSPSIPVQILQTVLNTFPKECLENLIKDLCNFPLLITLIILTTISLENVFKLLGENWWWSNLRFTGLSSSRNLVVHLLQSMAWLFILLKIIVLNSKVISCVLTNNTFYNRYIQNGTEILNVNSNFKKLKEPGVDEYKIW